MTIGWEEVAKATGASMVGGDLILHDPTQDPQHVRLGGKDERGQFTFTDEGQAKVLELTAAVQRAPAGAAPRATPTPRRTGAKAAAPTLSPEQLAANAAALAAMASAIPVVTAETAPITDEPTAEEEPGLFEEEGIDHTLEVADEADIGELLGDD